MNLDKIFKKNTYLPPKKDELSFSSYLLMINTMPIIEVDFCKYAGKLTQTCTVPCQFLRI